MCFYDTSRSPDITCIISGTGSGIKMLFWAQSVRIHVWRKRDIQQEICVAGPINELSPDSTENTFRGLSVPTSPDFNNLGFLRLPSLILQNPRTSSFMGLLASPNIIKDDQTFLVQELCSLIMYFVLLLILEISDYCQSQ